MSKRKWLKIERPKAMPSFEKFEDTAKKHLMGLTGLSQAEVDEYYAREKVKKEVKAKYEAFLSEVQKDPKYLRHFEGRIGTLNSSFWLDIERPKTMPTFEEFDKMARMDFMLSFELSKAEADEYFDREDINKIVKGRYEDFLEDVQKDPEELRYFSSRISSLNYCLFLMY